MKKLKTAFVCIGIVLTLQSVAQEIPIGILPMQFSGGFAGEGDKPRFAIGSVLSSSNFWEYTRRDYFASISLYRSCDRELDLHLIDSEATTEMVIGQAISFKHLSRLNFQ